MAGQPYDSQKTYRFRRHLTEMQNSGARSTSWLNKSKRHMIVTMAALLAAVKPAPAPGPAPAPAPAPAKAAFASALPSTIAPLVVQQFQHPSKRLVPKVVLNVHDVVLFCAHPSRFTPNVYALYAWARKQNEDTFLSK